MFIRVLKYKINKFIFGINILIFFLPGYLAYGLQPEPDRLYVHIDKPFYVSGETIQFKVYIFNDKISPSDLIHADLINEKGDIIYEELLKVNNNTSHGSIEVLLSQSEGMYFLRIYSIWNLNFSSNFNCIKPIAIYNDFNQSFENIIADTITIENIVKPENSQDFLDVDILNATSIHTGESIKMEIKDINHLDGDLEGNISVSVWEIDKCGFYNQNFVHSHYKRQNALSQSTNSINYQPEKSIQIEGKIYEIISRQPVTSKVLSVYNAETNTFTRINSEKNGGFSFDIPVFSGSVNLQVINMNPYQSKVNFVESVKLSKHMPIPNIEDYEIEKSPFVNNYLYYSGLRRKIYELFKETSFDSINLVETPILPFKPDKSYNTNDFQLLKNVEEFVREAVVNTSHINEGEEKKLLLFNQETKKYFMKSPWILVDGYFIFNDSLTYNIPFNILKRIDIYNTNKSILKYFEPIMIQGGIIAVYTKNNYLTDYIQSQPNTITVKGLTLLEEDTEKHNLLSPSSPHPMPALNPLIYWNPEIRFNEFGKADLEIQTNDVSGFYLIHMEGMDATGKPLSAQKIVQVLP